jgi:hypothetical protein
MILGDKPLIFEVVLSQLPPHTSPTSASLPSTYMTSSLGITPSRYGQPKDQGSKHHQLAIEDPRDSGSQSGEEVTDSPRRYCQASSLVSHILFCASFNNYNLYIRTNGNTLQLLVQVHNLLQCDDGKEGGTEHGGMPGLAIEIPKVQ